MERGTRGMWHEAWGCPLIGCWTGKRAERELERRFSIVPVHTHVLFVFGFSHTNTHVHTDTHAAQLQAKSAKNHTPMGQKEIATATVETNGQSWTDR